ncbi:hypothetical protein L7F22_068753 [Adiantum nelumboides]|nr:hypothetical protein [Adiantum nelumboides]
MVSKGINFSNGIGMATHDDIAKTTTRGEKASAVTHDDDGSMVTRDDHASAITHDDVGAITHDDNAANQIMEINNSTSLVIANDQPTTSNVDASSSLVAPTLENAIIPKSVRVAKMDSQRAVAYAVVGRAPESVQNPLCWHGHASADTVVHVLENSGVLL